MAYDFPPSPTLGQEYVAGTSVYVWNGYAWAMKAGVNEAPVDGKTYGRRNLSWTQVISQVVASEAPPPAMYSGEFWFETTTGYLWLNYDDGTSVQWVHVGAAIGLEGIQGETGPPGPTGPPAATGVSISFPFLGKPTVTTFVYVPVTMPLILAAGLAGAVSYANYAPTSNAAFTLSKISGGATTALGTITLTAGSKTAFTLAGAGGALAVGDVIQLQAPSPQDATLADVGITLQAARG